MNLHVLTCLETLDATVDDAKKRVIYFSSLQGQVLQRLKDISGIKLSQLWKLNKYLQSSVYHLTNLYNLVLRYSKLMYSDLSISFFHTNFREIENICQSDELVFKWLTMKWFFASVSMRNISWKDRMTTGTCPQK